MARRASKSVAQLWLAGLALAIGFAAAPSMASTITYTYDSQGHLVSAAYASDSTCQSFSYDPAENRTNNASTTPGPPVAVNDTVNTVENVAVTFSPLANDSSPSCYSLKITSPLGTPSHGTATIINSGTSVTYTPTSGYIGSDSFSYSISDGNGGTASATINVTVAENLVVTISAGPFDASGPLPTHTFAANTVTVTGGSGSYTYLWSGGGNGGTWSTGGTAASFSPSVSKVFEVSVAQYSCTVTDTVHNVQATSNTATYQWTNTSN